MSEKCGVVYSGPTFRHRHGTACALEKGHEAAGFRKHLGQAPDGHSIFWYTPEQKKELFNDDGSWKAPKRP